LELADALLEVGDLDSRAPDRRSGIDLAPGGGGHALELVLLEGQPALPAAQRGQRDHADREERGGGDDDLFAHVTGPPWTPGLNWLCWAATAGRAATRSLRRSCAIRSHWWSCCPW